MSVLRPQIGESRDCFYTTDLGEEYFCFNRKFLKLKNAQEFVDHILISPYGVFVFLTIPESGMVSGSPTSEMWDFHARTEEGLNFVEIENPIIKNERVKHFLSRQLGIEPTFIHTMALFTNTYLSDEIEGYCVPAERYHTLMNRKKIRVFSDIKAASIAKKFKKLLKKGELLEQENNVFQTPSKKANGCLNRGMAVALMFAELAAVGVFGIFALLVVDSVSGNDIVQLLTSIGSINLGSVKG